VGRGIARWVGALVLVAALVPAGARMAPAADANGVRLGIVNFLDRLVAPGVRYAALEVEVRGGRFRVAVSGLEVRVEDDRRIDIPSLEFWVRPERLGRFRVDRLRLGEPLAVRAPDGAAVGKILVRAPRLAGLFSPTLEGFLELDLSMRSIDVDLGPGRIAFALEDAALTLDGGRKADGSVDQNAHLRARALNARGRGGRTLEIAAIAVDGSAGTSGIEAYRGFLAELGRVATALVAGSGDTGAVLTAGLDGVSGTARDLSLAVRIEHGVLAGPGGGRIAVDGIEASLSAAGLDRPRSAAVLGLRVDGLSAAPLPADAPPLPETLALDLALDDLPLAELRAAPAAESNRPAVPAETGADAFENMAMAALGAAGTRLRLGPSRLATANAELRAQGDFAFDTAAVAGAVGTLDARVNGYDSLLALAGRVRTADGGAPIAGLLKLFRAAAESATDGDGRAVERLRLDITRDGGIAVNGRPLADLLLQSPAPR